MVSHVFGDNVRRMAAFLTTPIASTSFERIRRRSEIVSPGFDRQRRDILGTGLAAHLVNVV
jgi:hypothetical protein